MSIRQKKIKKAIKGVEKCFYLHSGIRGIYPTTSQLKKAFGVTREGMRQHYLEWDQENNFRFHARRLKK